MDLKRSLGFSDTPKSEEEKIRDIRYINLKLASMGLPIYEKQDFQVLNIAHDLIQNICEKNRLLSQHLCPADARIQAYLNDTLSDLDESELSQLPGDSFILDRFGLSRELSIPPDENNYSSDLVESYRIHQGVLHNPRNDRRTTKGVFHVAEGGLPVPFDKKSVPKLTFARLFKAALNPPQASLQLPFGSTQANAIESFVSLYVRPTVCPEVQGINSRKQMETRLFAPGSLVSNLDFVESIFGNAGDPSLPQNDAALAPDTWTGHTGCIILATHLTSLTKKSLGLPNIKDATERQRKDGMCWEKEDECYNDGVPFKITSRDDRGVIVTIIADNYFGYCKKEVKTQISYSANLFGLCEEEHAGGALAFPRYNLGDHFLPDSFLPQEGHCMNSLKATLGERVGIQPEGYGIDTTEDDIIYLPHDAEIDLNTQAATWTHDGKKQSIRVLAKNTYIHPTGYKINLEKHPGAPSWRLVGTAAEGVLCHKPCTVSGGGKSEISKSIWDAIHFGSFFVANFHDDMATAQAVIEFDYSSRFANPPRKDGHHSRKLLNVDRSLGSVIKLLTPSKLYTDSYNKWLKDIPTRIKSLVFMVKRVYRPDWGQNWRDQFSVDIINGDPANELKFNNRKLVSSFLRVGIKEDGAWWTCKLRQDFMPASKIQWEDDISASIVIPSEQLKNLNSEYKHPSVKIVENCEYRLFQRPDEAVNRGYDKQTESDLAEADNFISNFEPLDRANAVDIVEKAISFEPYSDPIKDVIREVATHESAEYFISSSHPRIVNGEPTKNPRYLQKRPDIVNPRDSVLADISTRLNRKLNPNDPVFFPVNCVLPGRRNNPAERKVGIRALAVYGPIHYQELPELFMDFICSLTGKSPSTTGAGSEGALTKGPFNALVPTTDLNNALLSYILTDYNGFSSAAGYIGPNYKVEHDVSLLIPELWCRLNETERGPKYMIDNGYLEALSDYEHNGKTIPASRLGYRITREFVSAFLGRIFDNPDKVFNSEMLKPELQDADDFADGILNITEAQERVAKAYLEDNSVTSAIPPIEALLHIMATGKFDGKGIDHPNIRKLFTRDYVLNADWYKTRLGKKQTLEQTACKRNETYLKTFLKRETHQSEADRLDINDRLDSLREHSSYVNSEKYLASLIGTIGADPLCR